MDVDVEVEADAWLLALPDCERLVRNAAEAALATEPAKLDPAEFSVAVLLTDDAEVRALNRDHRGQDKPTNVLSFPAAETAIGHLGDLALAFETCAREAGEQGKPLAYHLSHLVVHGVLHLTGWDHQADPEAEAMEELERTVLARLGVPDPYAA